MANYAKIAICFHTKIHLDQYVLSFLPAKNRKFDQVCNYRGGGCCIYPLVWAEPNIYCARV